MIVSESTASCSSWSFWRASSRSTSSTSLSAGLARRMTSLRSSPRPARPTPSSLRMIERRARSGSRMMLLSRSRSTDCSVFSTGSRYWPSPGPSSIRRSGPGASASTARLRRRLALDELLADQRLRADRALRVGAEVLVARVVDLQHDGGLEVRRHLDRVDRADLDAGHLDVLAGDDEAGVVEDRPHAVGVVLLARDEDERRERGDEQDGGDGDGGPHGPGGTWFGSQSSVAADVAPRRGAVRVGLRRRARAAPELVRLEPVEALRRRDRREHAARGVVVEVERVEDRLDPRVVAVGVVVGGAGAEVAQPAGEVGRVRAQELEHGLRLDERLAPVVERRRGDALQRGILRVASTRSLSSPSRRISVRRSRIVGRASATSGRSSRRNGARSFVAGLDSATSTSRSSSVARRFTNVVLARRSVVGSRPRARASATFSAADRPRPWRSRCRRARRGRRAARRGR